MEPSPEKKKAILKKVEKIEYNKRCLAAGVCPDCGGYISETQPFGGDPPYNRCDDCYRTWYK